MPDFERLLRKFEVDIAETDDERVEIKAKHHRQDKVRWKIVAVVLGAVVGLLVVSYFIGS